MSHHPLPVIIIRHCLALLIGALLPAGCGEPRETAKVVRVLDGDTVELENGDKLRYNGVNTPETDKDECYADEAKERNRNLVEGKTIEIELDEEKFDRFDRRLAWIYVGEVFVNAKLVEEGFARASPYAPNLRYEEEIADLEKEAQAAGRGLWGLCE